MLDTAVTVFTDNPASFVIVSALFGLLVGSFLNVVIYRLPVMLEKQWRQYCAEMFDDLPAQKNDSKSAIKDEKFNLAVPRSHCPHCKRVVRAWENIPVLSYVMLRGKCAGCGTAISVRYPLIELLSAVLSAVVASHFGFGLAACAGLLFTWVLIALSVIDYDTQLLPDTITLPLIWVGLLLSLGGAFVSPVEAIIGAVAGYMSLWFVYQLFRLLTGKEGMGFGDFKLLSALGAWLGWKLLPVIILLSSFAGAVLGVLLIVLRRHERDKPIPFGPYLAIAGWCAMLWGQEILDQYWKISGL
ncbi:MAG: A24 family peptidase [Gammaproteobacteria bacterium]|nr:A24 family peptidase [Gammaproteobacteria bacterium]